MYAREPDAFDELRGLATQCLGNETAAEILVWGAKAYRLDPKTPFPVIPGREEGSGP
jgi:hypothetical protein